MPDMKDEYTHVEVHEDGLGPCKAAAQEVQVMGTVRLTEGAIVYVPRPTADPQDPLNVSTPGETVFMLFERPQN